MYHKMKNCVSVFCSYLLYNNLCSGYDALSSEVVDWDASPIQDTKTVVYYVYISVLTQPPTALLVMMIIMRVIIGIDQL